MWSTLGLSIRAFGRVVDNAIASSDYHAADISETIPLGDAANRRAVSSILSSTICLVQHLLYPPVDGTTLANRKAGLRLPVRLQLLNMSRSSVLIVQHQRSEPRRTVLDLEKVNDAASTSFHRRNFILTGSIAVDLPKPFSAATSAIFCATRPLSLMSSQHPLHEVVAR